MTAARNYRDLGILSNAGQHADGYPRCTCGKAGLGTGGEGGAAGHHVINQQNLAPLDGRGVAGMGANRRLDIAEATVTVAAILCGGAAGALQQVGDVVERGEAGEGGGEQRRLVVAAAQEAEPVQRHRGDEHPGGEEGGGRAVLPAGGRRGKIAAVAVFEGQHQLAPVVAIQERGAAMMPGPGKGEAIVAMDGLGVFARKGGAATVTNKAGDEPRLAPAGGAQGEVALYPVAAGEALRGIDQMEQSLHSHSRFLMFRAMQTPPPLTDRQALTRYRARAERTALFLHDEVFLEAQERLAEVNRAFTDVAVVTPFLDLWPMTARKVADDEVLDLQPGGHDLVIHALALHWANDPVGQLVQCRRALRADGLFLGFLFGGQTLSELRACLAQAEAEVTGGLSPRVLPMGEIRDLGALLQRAGFALPVADSFTKTVTYGDFGSLLRDLRLMGEGNALTARLRRPTRRAVFGRAAELYAQHHALPDGRLTATFEIIGLTGWAPHESQQKPLRPGSAAQRLADALSVPEVRLPDTEPNG